MITEIPIHYYTVAILNGSAIVLITEIFGHQEEHPACKKLSDKGWHGYLSGARCK